MTCGRQPAATAGIATGLTVVALGVLLLLGNLGVIRPVNIFAFFPPVVLVVAGVVNLLNGRAPVQIAWGLVLAATGAYWIASNLGYAPVPMRKVWPVLLIALGLTFLWQALQRSQAAAATTTVSTSALNELAVFGGVQRAVKTPDFHGGSAFALFGGCDIDLRQSQISRDQACIDISAILGGVELKVPADWQVNTQGVAIFGGFEDKTVHPRSDSGSAQPKQLVVRGFAMFGGVEIKN